MGGSEELVYRAVFIGYHRMADLLSLVPECNGVTMLDDDKGPSKKAVLRWGENVAEIYLFGAHIWR
eukprot:1398000-Amphidinium_carterae.1